MQIKLLEGGKLPQKMTEGAACADVFAREVKKISDDFYKIHLGFCCEVPKGFRLMLQLRSNACKNRWVMINQPGVIDSDYRGEVQMWLRGIPSYLLIPSSHNGITGFEEVNHETFNPLDFTYDDFPFKAGDSVGQIYLEKEIPLNFEEASELSETPRGAGAFGSTTMYPPNVKLYHE